MIKAYQYRLYPNMSQKSILDDIIDVARWLYNRALEYRRKRWNESRRTVTYIDQCAMWRDWRNEQPEDNPLRLLNMTAGQNILRRLDKAYRDFMRGKRGRPRFKGYRRFNSVSYTYDDGIRLDGDKVYIQNVGKIKVKWHRELPNGVIRNVVLTRKPSGWYASFQVECVDVEVPASQNPPVGIDIGIHHALALSDGTIIDSPQHLKQSLKKLRYLQRKLARRQKDSTGWKEAAFQVAKEHEHIANQRRDWWHKITFWVIATYGVVVLEDLSLSFMTRNGNLSRSSHDIALGIFREILYYKAIQAGVSVFVVNPKNTSQQCSNCKEIVPKELSVRIHSCPYCGFTADRDVNAALNILNLGWETASKR